MYIYRLFNLYILGKIVDIKNCIVANNYEIWNGTKTKSGLKLVQTQKQKEKLVGAGFEIKTKRIWRYVIQWFGSEVSDYLFSWKF